jgi:hypothetical protein
MGYLSHSIGYFPHSHSEIRFLKRIDLNQWVIFPIHRSAFASALINNHWWFIFSIYTIETHEFKSSSSSLHPLYLHELLQRGVMKPKVASRAIPLETPASV